ncbi:MAG: site-specific integrase [Patescibacteria group bacterium]
MPIKQRCSACHTFVAYGLKRCTCGGEIGQSVFLVTTIRGKRRTKNLKVCSHAVAKAAERRWLLELHEGTNAAISPPSLRTVFTDYLGKLRSEGKSYLSNSALFLERMLDVWGEIESGDLTTEMVMRFQVRLRDTGYSPAYCDRHIAVGKAAWQYTLSRLPNPFKHPVKLFNADNTLVRFLSSEEEARLIDAAHHLHPNSPPLHDFIVIALNTGLREANIMRLHASEVDFETCTITVRQKRDRGLSVPMNEVVRDLLVSRPTDGWFFPNPATGKPYTRLDKSFATARRLAGIMRPFRFHDLRHHFARRILLATKNLRLTGLLLGHSNPVTTTKYAHLVMDDMREAVDMLVSPKPDGYKNGYALETSEDKTLN